MRVPGPVRELQMEIFRFLISTLFENALEVGKNSRRLCRGPKVIARVHVPPVVKEQIFLLNFNSSFGFSFFVPSLPSFCQVLKEAATRNCQH